MLVLSLVELPGLDCDACSLVCSAPLWLEWLLWFIIIGESLAPFALLHVPGLPELDGDTAGDGPLAIERGFKFVGLDPDIGTNALS